MNKSYIDKHGWVFEFNRETFVTTFAPFYPASHSEDAFVLCQPEISFAPGHKGNSVGRGRGHSEGHGEEGLQRGGEGVCGE